MRVLHVIGQMGYGGAELLVAQLATRMVREGHEVSVFVLGFREPRVVMQLRAAGVRILGPSRLAPVSSVANAISIARAARNADVVHAHLFPALYLVAAARALTPMGATWVYTEHSTNNRRRRHQWLAPAEAFVYRRYDRIACVSANAAVSFRQWVPTVAPVVIENGIDVERFRAGDPDRGRHGVLPGQVVLVAIGAHRPEKNHEALLRALAQLPHDHILLLAGDGPTRPTLEQQVQALDLSGRVRFLGVVEETEDLLAIADALVLPSLFEGLSLTALEAAAAGTPVVYSDVPGLADLMAGAGWPCSPTDPSSIAEAVRGAVAAGRSAPEVVRGREVAARHSILRTVDAYRGLYLDGREERAAGRLPA